MRIVCLSLFFCLSPTHTPSIPCPTSHLLSSFSLVVFLCCWQLPGTLFALIHALDEFSHRVQNILHEFGHDCCLGRLQCPRSRSGTVDWPLLAQVTYNIVTVVKQFDNSDSLKMPLGISLKDYSPHLWNVFQEWECFKYKLVIILWRPKQSWYTIPSQ